MFVVLQSGYPERVFLVKAGRRLVVLVIFNMQFGYWLKNTSASESEVVS